VRSSSSLSSEIFLHSTLQNGSEKSSLALKELQPVQTTTQAETQSPIRPKIERWFYTHRTLTMVIIREDKSIQSFKTWREMLKLPKEDLEVLYRLPMQLSNDLQEGHAKKFAAELRKHIHNRLFMKKSV